MFMMTIEIMSWRIH